MNRLLVTALGVALAASTGLASAQSYSRYPVDSGPNYGQTVQYDYARVVRVDPVFDSYATSSQGQRCYERPTYVSGSGDYYPHDGSYRRDDSYYPQRTVGTEGGRTAATVIGGIVGAVVGSQVGGGSARYATSAVGSMLGGMAGRQIYEQSKRTGSDRTGTVRVCDPVPVRNDGYYSGDRAVSAYDVTYEYAGRTYTTRTSHHPGDRLRVRVDVRPE